MTKDEASKILSNHINTGINNRKINLAAGDMEQAVSVSAFKIEFDADKAVSDAYGVGRSGSLISRYFLYRKIRRCDDGAGVVFRNFSCNRRRK